MELAEEKQGAVTVLSPDGRVDSSNAKAFEEAVMSRLAAVEGPVLIDLAQLRYISSAGLRVILLSAKQQQQKGQRFALCEPSADIREVFEVSGFTKIIEIFQKRDQALAAL